MRRLPALLALAASLNFVSAQAVQPTVSPAPSKKTTTAAPAATMAPTPVPADVRARVVAKLHGATTDDVATSPVPGLYEVTMGGLIAYVSADGKYLISGNVYDLDSQENLTASRRNTARAKALAGVSESQMIVYGPSNAKMTVTVFTDVDCGYCRKFHSQMAGVVIDAEMLVQATVVRMLFTELIEETDRLLARFQETERLRFETEVK